MARLERKQQESQNNANDLKELNRMRVDLEKQSEGKADLPDFARLYSTSHGTGLPRDQPLTR